MKEEQKILIVDDEADILEFVSYNLNKEGYNVKTAKSGKKALKILSDWVPELIMLDIMMPDMDGIELCQNIREIPELNQSLIVFLTARGESYTQTTILQNR